MQDKSDTQLLREYAEYGSEAAFGELVVRHTDLVYSAALRQVESPDLARDVAQSVFTDLARKARSLAGKMSDNASLAGWLYRSTRFAALTLLRDDRRRQSRERQAMQDFDSSSDTSPDWDRVRPVLDEAMANLCNEDRDALLLRFFKNQEFRAVGTMLGVSDDAAQKRVTRALEKLRSDLLRRGVATTAAALSTALVANAVQIAPAGLAGALANASLAGATIHAATAIAATKAIAMTTLQKILIAATLSAAVSTGIYEARQASSLRAQVQTLQEQQTPFAEQIQQLERERNEVASRLALLADEMERMRGNSTELLRLRGEVTRLRSDSKELAQLKAADAQQSDDPMETAAKELRAKVNLLKQRLDQRSETKIPELKYLNSQDWLRIAQDARFRVDNPNEEQVLSALSTVRRDAKQKFAEQMGVALRTYVQANGGELPGDVAQLKSYFSPPTVDATLQRYQMLKSGSVSELQPKELVVAEKAPVDDQYDTLWQIGLYHFQWQGTGKESRAHGYGSWEAAGSRGVKPHDPNLKATTDALMPVLNAFAAANGGRQPSEPSQLQPYITTPEQQAAFHKAIEAIDAAKNASQR